MFPNQISQELQTFLQRSILIEMTPSGDNPQVPRVFLLVGALFPPAVPVEVEAQVVQGHPVLPQGLQVPLYGRAAHLRGVLQHLVAPGLRLVQLQLHPRELSQGPLRRHDDNRPVIHCRAAARWVSGFNGLVKNIPGGGSPWRGRSIKAQSGSQPPGFDSCPWSAAAYPVQLFFFMHKTQ